MSNFENQNTTINKLPESSNIKNTPSWFDKQPNYVVIPIYVLLVIIGIFTVIDLYFIADFLKIQSMIKNGDIKKWWEGLTPTKQKLWIISWVVGGIPATIIVFFLIFGPAFR